MFKLESALFRHNNKEKPSNAKMPEINVRHTAIIIDNSLRNYDTRTLPDLVDILPLEIAYDAGGKGSLREISIEVKDETQHLKITFDSNRMHDLYTVEQHLKKYTHIKTRKQICHIVRDTSSTPQPEVDAKLYMKNTLYGTINTAPTPISITPGTPNHASIVHREDSDSVWTITHDSSNALAHTCVLDIHTPCLIDEDSFPFHQDTNGTKTKRNDWKMFMEPLYQNMEISIKEQEATIDMQWTRHSSTDTYEHVCDSNDDSIQRYKKALTFLRGFSVCTVDTKELYQFSESKYTVHLPKTFIKVVAISLNRFSFNNQEEGLRDVSSGAPLHEYVYLKITNLPTYYLSGLMIQDGSYVIAKIYPNGNYVTYQSMFKPQDAKNLHDLDVCFVDKHGDIIDNMKPHSFVLDIKERIPSMTSASKIDLSEFHLID